MASQLKRANRKTIEERIIRFINLETAGDFNQRNSSVSLPGFGHADITRTGHVAIWSIVKTAELFLLSLQNTPMVLFKGAVQQVMPIVVAHNVTINQPLYSTAAMNRPIRLDIAPGHKNDRTMSFMINIIDEQTKQVLATAQRQFTFFDVHRKKASPIPGHISESLGPRFNPKVTPIHYISPEPETPIHKVNLTVRHSDSDQEYHVTNSVYFKYCMDVAATICQKGILRNFSGDIFDCQVANVIARHQGECYPEEELEVTLWEDNSHSNILHFLILKGQKKVFSASFTFCRLASSKL